MENFDYGASLTKLWVENSGKRLEREDKRPTIHELNQQCHIFISIDKSDSLL